MSISRHKIKVCHLASGDLWAGAEVQVVNVCRGLRDTGVVDVSAIVLNCGRLVDELRSLDIDVKIIDEQTNLWWAILSKLTRELRARPVDILHTHRYKENILGSVAARISGVPHVVRTVHGTTEMYLGRKWLKAGVYETLDDIVCRYFVSGVIGVSREITQNLMGRFPDTTVVHIPNCIDEHRLVPTTGREEKRLELGVKPAEFVIGTVGRLAPVKGTEYLIRAVPEIVRRFEDIRILVVGDGPLRPHLEKLVHSLGLEKTVIFLGSRDDTVDIINALDLFVLPSIHEGMPTVVLEAMALGVPVVASATGGIPDLVTDGSNGLLTDPGNDTILAMKCLSLMADCSLAKRLIRNATQSMRQYYVHNTVSSMLAFYRRVGNVRGC